MADVESQFECQQNDTTRNPEPDATRANDAASNAMRQHQYVVFALNVEMLALTHNLSSRLLGPSW